MHKPLAMRDTFWNKIYDLSKRDKDIIVLSGDMGAPSLDRFRKDFGERFFNVGIAEQNMIGVASGLAREGKKVFTYAIAPFITSRPYEFTKLCAGLMKIPINLVGVGVGFGYEDSGPTHHTTEDISIMRAIPNLEVFCPSDSQMAGELAEQMYNSNKPTYIRLDRHTLQTLSNEEEIFKEGFREFGRGKMGIVATGNMVHTALETQKKLKKEGDEIGVIDLYRLNPINPKFKTCLHKYDKIISLEEHLLNGGLGSIISEVITDNDLSVRLRRMGLTDYIYAYGGRENIQKTCNIDVESVTQEIRKF